ERLLDLLNNVLDFARLDSGPIELSNEVFRPTALAREVIELLSSRAHGRGLDIALRCKTPRSLTLNGDSGKTRQILFNLIGNALKFTDTGSILVDLDYRDEALQLDIYDTGPGISDEDQERLFHAFEQVNADDAQKDGGVGLGLAIVRRICDLMGGDISVTSQLGVGTCFQVRLPFERVTPREHFPANDAIDGRVVLVGLPSGTVLSTTTSLHRAGATVMLADTVKTAKSFSPTLILANADLPERSLRALCKAAPTLIVLRHEDRSLLPRFRTYGATGWLIRPLRAASLVERVGLAIKGGLPGDAETPESGSGHILIADDNPINGLIARRALESSGFAVTLASTGREALDVVEQISPDLILMDLRMPIMDGFEAMKRLRAGGSQIPVIAVSAEINPEIEKRARACGADGVAAKPLEAEALRQLAFKWIATDAQAGVA
ncbi:MAG: ATP-binding protein, partial [Pseudomonadota bacterium]